MTKKKKTLKIALVALVVAGVCCGLSTCATWMLTPREVATVVEVTETPTAAALVPMEVIPTSTPEPTSTPVVDRVKEYAEELVPLMFQYADAFGAVSALMGSYSFNEDLTGFDSSWKVELYSVLDEVLAIGFQIRELEPPLCYIAAHSLLIEALDHVDSGNGFLVAGVDSFDPDLVKQATEEWILGQRILEEAKEEMDSVTAYLEAGGSCE